ncbi:hypothetical protein BGZ60DRAFT_405507 [Tricladium varicosporioides]|nr:hypothetical protein BGZ60DRAFT_405507 [Hymenoscyphus varicosporioides]
MSSSSSPSSSAPFKHSSHSNPDTLKDTLEDTVPRLKDPLLQSENALLQHDETLLRLTDRSASPLYENTQSESFAMSPDNRSAGRDVHIFDANDRNTSIGGLILTSGITNDNLYSMIEIFVFFDGKYILRSEDNIMIERNDSPLLPGNYYIVSPNPIRINDEKPLTRMISLSTGTRVQSFRDTVRSRDRRCVITGEEVVNATLNNWTGFEATHIFPLALERLWNDHNYGRWILCPPDGKEIKGGKINSGQNGLLLRSDIHQLFDTYMVSINPDDNYKVICFCRDGKGIAGKRFHQQPAGDPLRPADELLRWHFRQAVLVNMKGVGEPIFEHDFPPGSDMIGSILKGPKAAERIEFELFSRMAAEFDLTQEQL